MTHNLESEILREAHLEPLDLARDQRLRRRIQDDTRVNVILRNGATKNLVVRAGMTHNLESEILREAHLEPLDLARDQRLRRRIQDDTRVNVILRSP
jgi:hypothetical protein